MGVTHAAKVMVHAFKPSTQEAEVSGVSEASLVYREFQGCYTKKPFLNKTTKNHYAVNFSLGNTAHE